MTRAFVELADTMVDDYDIIDLLDRLVAHCIQLLATQAAGILLTDASGGLQVVASSNEDAELMDLNSTPTFFVNGLRHKGPWDAATLIRALGATRSDA